ncbi:MAG: D-alanine--D-alanine ligase [Termitinemataceae bacterium]|nr:MAG: D-alanine--D-alanine ligase [Termitinemataceae bacterium]
MVNPQNTKYRYNLQKNVYDAIDRNKYDPILIGIDKNGAWLLADSKSIINDSDPKNIKLNTSGDTVALVPNSKGNISNLKDLSKHLDIDVVFPILHGPFGEDGTVQGLLKLADIPFAGSGVLGSAVGMDKDVMKRLLTFANIPIGKYLVVNANDKLPTYETVKEAINIPCFVKPANMGSSVGVEKIHNSDEYIKFSNMAFQYDTKIILEEFIEGREIECAVLGNENPIASILGEIKSSHEFYSYNAKYLDENGAVLEIPAKLDSVLVTQIQTLAIQTFKALYAQGLSRIDFFLKYDGTIYVNEINTMPGFTKISMYPKLWEASGISYTDLIDRLIQLAFDRYKKESKIETSYLNI